VDLGLVRPRKNGLRARRLDDGLPERRLTGLPVEVGDAP
jgi:hypothetical protein